MYEAFVLYWERALCLLPRIDPTGFMRVKMNITLRKRTLGPVRLVLEDVVVHLCDHNYDTPHLSRSTA